VGTPFGITVDGESITNGTVTVRDRDTLKQERVDAARLKDYLSAKLTP
jgi:glycyl-tRNA synthetase